MIQPALTPSEWADYLGARGALPWDEDFRIHVGQEHATAAKLLHGQSFGFTWEDVDAIRVAADVLDAEHGFDHEHEPIDHGLRYPMALLADAAADVIAALLPPREPKP